MLIYTSSLALDALGGARRCPPPPTFRVGIAPALKLKYSQQGCFIRAVVLYSANGADSRPFPLSVRQSLNNGQSERYPVFGFFFHPTEVYEMLTASNHRHQISKRKTHDFAVCTSGLWCAKIDSVLVVLP